MSAMGVVVGTYFPFINEIDGVLQGQHGANV